MTLHGLRHNIRIPLIILATFLAVAAERYASTGRLFYLFNFLYIGVSVSAGVLLYSLAPRNRKDSARRLVQLLVGGYMLVYLGFVRGENMQIEGFFLYLFAGALSAASLHYLVAKIGGALLFGRGWCGWACWTAMLLDFLPWKRSPGRRQGFSLLRAFHLAVALGLALALFHRVPGGALPDADLEMALLLIGNAAYYLLGFVLAATLKDNRAFCKYVCPIPVLQKLPARAALLKITFDADKCVDCAKCEAACPMDVRLLRYKHAGQRVLSTECVLCQTCANVCPYDALSVTSGG